MAEKLSAAERVRAKAQESVEWLLAHGVWPTAEGGGNGGNGAAVSAAAASVGGSAGGGGGGGGGGSAFLARFSAAWVHSRVVSAAIGVLEKAPLRDHATAARWLRGLLSSACLPARRAGAL
eukprot:SAG22_NODE_1218_length_5138_cov_4.648938_2_plen_121_part_00